MKIETKKKVLSCVMAAAMLVTVPVFATSYKAEAASSDLYPSAVKLENNSPVSDSLSYGSTREYKYTAGGSGAFYFEVDAQFSCSVYLYDSTGKKLDNLNTDHYLSKEFKAVKGTVYYIVVGPSYSAANQYTITAHQEGETITEIEPNNTEAEATPISAGTRAYGYTSGFSDFDYYLFQAPSDGKLIFSLTKESTGETARWDLVCDAVTYTMEPGDARISTNQMNVKKGQKIYALVRSNAGAAGESYSIVADFAKLNSSDIAASVGSSKGTIKKFSAKKDSISFTAGCDKVYGAKVKYQVRIKKSGTLKYKNYNFSKKNIKIKKLSRYTEYTLNVRPYVTVSGKKYYGQWSETKLIRTKK